MLQEVAEVTDRRNSRSMSQSVIVMGMVLTAMPVNDYDKRITILTKERGKITAFARGSRRPSSQLLAATNPFAFGEFEVFEGRNSYNVTKANIQNYFRELVLDLDAASLAFYFAEFAEYYCQENNDEREMLKLLYQSFRALENSRYSKELVRAVFELKAITINGEGPQVFACMHCHAKEDPCFVVKRGGILSHDNAYRQTPAPSPLMVMAFSSNTARTSSLEYLLFFQCTKRLVQKLKHFPLIVIFLTIIFREFCKVERKRCCIQIQNQFAKIILNVCLGNIIGISSLKHFEFAKGKGIRRCQQLARRSSGTSGKRCDFSPFLCQNRYSFVIIIDRHGC